MKKTTLFEPEYITHLLDKYGNVINLQFLNKNIYLIADPSSLTYIFDRPTIYLRSKQALGNTDELFGKEGLVNVQDLEMWKKDRTVIGELFSAEQMKLYTNIMVETVQSQFKAWQKYADQHLPFPLDQFYNAMTAHNVINTLLPGITTEPEIISETGRELAYLTLPFFYFTKAKLFGIIPMPQYSKGKKLLNDFADHILKQSLDPQAPEKNLIKHLAKNYNCSSYDELTPELKQHLHSEALTFLIAGHETTAALMGYLTIYLALHPEIFAKVSDEVEQLLKGNPPQYEDLTKLIYTRAVIKEALRIRPPARVIVRVPNKDDAILKFNVKEDDVVYIPIFSLHRLKAFWDEPEVFNPDRFLKPLTPDQQILYMPFGRGDRNCIGSQFATMEATIILALLVKRFRFKLPAHFKLEREPAMFDRIAKETTIFIENIT